MLITTIKPLIRRNSLDVNFCFTLYQTAQFNYAKTPEQKTLPCEPLFTWLAGHRKRLWVN
jgi:hypothetical protein